MVKTIARLTLPFALLDDGTFEVTLNGKTAIITTQRETTVSRQGQMMGMEFVAPVVVLRKLMGKL